ncbi:MAG: branched-chain amino acid ABC transporter permease [Oscillospiraceae bacterium]|nr:branched-chain amino acid ABC transporter permease [Oscillospiraceae bacterium]
MANFLQNLTNALSLGSLYALIAIGYTMVYGILRLINFAHGDIFMMSVYFAFYGIIMFLIPWPITFILAIVLTAALGITIEKAAYSPLRDAPKISIMISAIGVSFFLENLAVVLFGGITKAFPSIDLFTQVMKIGPVSLQRVNLIIPILTILFLVILLFIINHTKSGMAMRALSKDHEAARLMGVNVNNIISITFAIGSTLAAIGGIMWGLKYTTVQPYMGMMPGLKCFIAAVVGGIGNIKGAVIGALILGVGEIMIIALPNMLGLSVDITGYRDAFAFIVLIIILLFRPTGIMGEKIANKV